MRTYRPGPQGRATAFMWRQWLLPLGITVGVVVKGSTAAEFGTFMASEYKRWNAVRETAGIAQQ